MSEEAELINQIEALIFSSHVPISAEKIVKQLEHIKPVIGEVRDCLYILQEHYENRGVQLVEVASGWRFQVALDCAPTIVKTLEEKPTRLSRALLETLALIAYRQPITRGEIESIRGVVVSTNMIKTLLEHEWIRVVGHKDVPGKPALYATTKIFLDDMGLKKLDELPPLSEIKALIPTEDNVTEDTQDNEAAAQPEETQVESLDSELPEVSLDATADDCDQDMDISVPVIENSQRSNELDDGGIDETEIKKTEENEVDDTVNETAMLNESEESFAHLDDFKEVVLNNPHATSNQENASELPNDSTEPDEDVQSIDKESSA